jgi:hypothetical protein
MARGWEQSKISLQRRMFCATRHDRWSEGGRSGSIIGLFGIEIPGIEIPSVPTLTTTPTRAGSSAFMFRCDDFVAICAVGVLTLLSPVDEATLSLNSFSSSVPLSSRLRLA